MAAPTALDNARTGTPDGTSGVQIPTVVMQEASYEAPGGIDLSDRIASSVAPDRDNATAVDSATDMSTTAFAGASGANLTAVNNRGAIVVWCTFEASTDSAAVRLVYYDAADAPLFVGPPLAFAALAGFRLSAAGHYMSEPRIVESYGASQIRPYIASKGDAVNDVDVFTHPI
jgi:hypothetical protein